LGYQFNKTWGLEFGYRDYGNSALRDVLPSGNPVTLDLSLDTRGSYLAGAGEWQLNELWFLQAKLGLLRSRVKLEASNGRREARDDSGLFASAALGYRFGDSWRVSVQWERVSSGRFDPAPGLTRELGSSHFNVFIASLEYTF
jgi:hypothetical protein